MEALKMNTVKTIDQIKFNLEFMVMMMNTDRMEEANTSLQKALELLDGLKASVSVEGSTVKQGA
jgi:flagellin-specific chaperone FliS